MDDSSRMISQVDAIKSEPASQDIAMEDAPSPANGRATTAKVNLEDLFDDSDSDPEFTSSAPQVKAEEEPSQLSQPEPMYFTPHWSRFSITNNSQQNKLKFLLL